VEIITSRKQAPKEDWLNYVVTAKARHKDETGPAGTKAQSWPLWAGTLVQHQLRAWGAKVNAENIDILQDHLLASSPNDLYWQLARGRHDLAKLPRRPT
jgi:guanosine-3',5'-bis(diphosphate) 3'-pyrophosphohydrolase